LHRKDQLQDTSTSVSCCAIFPLSSEHSNRVSFVTSQRLFCRITAVQFRAKIQIFHTQIRVKTADVNNLPQLY
jgi:hypothetical protein